MSRSASRRLRAVETSSETGATRRVVSILDRAGAAKIFAIRTPTEAEPQSLQADMDSWPVPSLVLLRGTRLGLLDAAMFDARLYLGPTSKITTSKRRLRTAPR